MHNRRLITDVHGGDDAILQIRNNTNDPLRLYSSYDSYGISCGDLVGSSFQVFTFLRWMLTSPFTGETAFQKGCDFPKTTQLGGNKVRAVQNCPVSVKSVFSLVGGMGSCAPIPDLGNKLCNDRGKAGLILESQPQGGAAF